jgi:transcription elongation factor GreA-like protein
LEYWNIYSESRTDSKAISIEDLYDFFKATNSFDEIDECGENENVIFCMNDGISKELNESITEDEIRNIVNNLSNNKAGGYDRILHEYIKSTIDQCIDIYVQLFNLVFDSGFFPECWTVGIIRPLYKNKGDPTNPENYRPITLLSCMDKVFTAILNRRL